jgi:ankyrin repeat protein
MPKDSSGQQLIHACTSGDLVAVRKLLDEGVDVNWKDDEDGWTALMCASYQGHVKVVKLLLVRGALIDIQINGGSTALIAASFYGKIECVRLLLERGADMSLKHNNGKTAKDAAVKQGYADIVHLLNEVRNFKLKINNSNTVILDLTFYYS